MNIGTYAALKAAALDWATRSGLSTQLPQFVDWAHQEICRRLRAPILYARTNVTVNDETVDAPSGFLAAKRFYLDVTPRRVLQLTDSGKLMDLAMNATRGDYPTHFAVEGRTTLAFAPLFSGSATGKLLYYKAPDALTNDADTNVVLTAYPFLYLFGTLEALYRYFEDDEQQQRYGGLFGALLQSINDEEAKDAMRGPIVGSAGSAVV